MRLGQHGLQGLGGQEDREKGWGGKARPKSSFQERLSRRTFPSPWVLQSWAEVVTRGGPCRGFI